MATATFIEKEQEFHNEITIYWFELSGDDRDTGINFDGEDWIYGIAEQGPTTMVLDADGDPVDEIYPRISIAVRNTAEVTDKMRAE